jgi:hypothetical protein
MNGRAGDAGKAGPKGENVSEESFSITAAPNHSVYNLD